MKFNIFPCFICTRWCLTSYKTAINELQTRANVAVPDIVSTLLLPDYLFLDIW